MKYFVAVRSCNPGNDFRESMNNKAAMLYAKYQRSWGLGVAEKYFNTEEEAAKVAEFWNSKLGESITLEEIQGEWNWIKYCLQFGAEPQYPFFSVEWDEQV